MSFTVDARDFERAAAALEGHGFDRVAGRTVQGAIRKMINAVRRHVRAAAKPHRRTGRLSSNVRVYFTGQGMDFVGRVKAAGPVAHLIIGGVRPHQIRTRHVMALRGPGRAAPVIGFAQAVQHPGFRADPFFARGVSDASADMQQIIEQAADRMVDDLTYRLGKR